MAEIRLDGVRKFFGSTEVLKGIDLALREGEFLVLVGPSGCGKSTLLNLIAGLETISAGDIYIDERRVNDVPPKDRDIAMVFQSYALYPTMTVRGNMTFGMTTRSVPRHTQTQAVEDVAQLLQIGDFLERKPGQLSGGQRQRVAMGRALVREPAVFLFDEPRSNLHAKLRIEMRTEIKKLHQRLGKTSVYVTHDQVEAMTLASRIAVMDSGHIRQFATPAEVYNDPADLFVAGFMGSPSMNMLRGRVRVGDGVVISIDGGGESVDFPAPQAQADRIATYDGREVILGIRPETISAAGDGVQDHEGFVFERAVEVVEPTGPDTLIIFALGDGEAVARVRPEEERPAGTSFRFEVDMSKAKVFDPESGARI